MNIARNCIPNEKLRHFDEKGSEKGWERVRGVGVKRGIAEPDLKYGTAICHPERNNMWPLDSSFFRLRFIIFLLMFL
jgi:hypothetical protein